MSGFHHLRRRARVSKGLEPFPARVAWKRGLDYVMYGVGVFAPLALLPQIERVYTEQSAGGLSFITWTLLCIFNGMWGLYGLVHRDLQIFLANCLMLLFNGVILLGILLYS
jgi:uncharacterized protein with PQ loop repeat